MQVLMKDQALDNFFKEVVDAFQVIRPTYMERVRHRILEQEARLIKPSGMTTGGHMKMTYYMPPALYHFARQQAKKRLNLDHLFAGPDRHKHYQMLVKHVSFCKVRTKPTPFLDLGAKCEPPSQSPSASA